MKRGNKQKKKIIIKNKKKKKRKEMARKGKARKWYNRETKKKLEK